MTSDTEVVTPSAKEVAFELLKRKLDEATGLLTHFLRAFAIFLAIMGVLLKFALDENATPELRNTMGLFGLLVCGLSFLAGYFGERWRRKVLADIANLAKLLDAPSLDSTLTGVKFTIITALGFALIMAAGWIFLLRDAL